MVNEQERESRGRINPYINFFKFLNTSVQYLKKGHKEISVLNPLCSDSALLVNKKLIRVKPLIEFQEGE